MSWSGGTYTKGNNATGGWTGDASLGIGIEAGRHDTQDNDFATGINTCLTKDGQNAATADLPMGGFKHTNVAVAAARNQYGAVSQIQDGDFIWLGTTGGTATAQTATSSPQFTAYKAGQKFRMKIGATLGSTGATPTVHTLQINGIASPKNIVNNEDATNPTLGTWVAGALMEVVYDGTNFVITNDPGGWLTWTPTLSPGSGSITSVTVTTAKYRKTGKQLTVMLMVVFNTTSVGDRIRLTLPISHTITLSGWYAPALIGNGAATVLTAVFADTTTGLTFFGNGSGTISSSWGSQTAAAIYGTYIFSVV